MNILHMCLPLLIPALALTGCASLQQQQQANRFYDDIQTFVEQDTQSPPPKDAVLFIGSSSIRMWDSLHKDFPQYEIIQRGFGGSTFADANLFFDEIVTPYQPRAIVVFEGSNDIKNGKSAEQVFKDYKQFVNLVRAREVKYRDLDPAPILYIGVTPTESRWQLWPEMRKLNQMIQQYTEQHHGLYYIDTPTPILATAPKPGGPPARELFRDDQLHLSPKGYALWTKVVTPELEAVCPPVKAKHKDESS